MKKKVNKTEKLFKTALIKEYEKLKKHAESKPIYFVAERDKTAYDNFLDGFIQGFIKGYKEIK